MIARNMDTLLKNVSRSKNLEPHSQGLQPKQGRPIKRGRVMTKRRNKQTSFSDKWEKPVTR